MPFPSLDIKTFEPESNWHLCSYRGWLIAVLPLDKGFVFEYLAPDGESRGFDQTSYSSIEIAMKQAKNRIKQRVTVWLMDQWLCEAQEQGMIDFKEYCYLFKSMH